MKNIFCVDLEDWYHQSLTREVKNPQPLVDRHARIIIDILKKTNSRATFFVVGEVAKQFPELICEIRDAGHEIACHSYSHKRVNTLTPDEFRCDMEDAIEAIEKVCGVRVRGFRAPSWSVLNESLWALDILKDLGFAYDSSIFPVSNFLYGIPDSPRFAHNRPTSHGDILEIPPSTFDLFGRNMGFSGGFYFRVLPLWLIQKNTKRINEEEKQPVIFYIHPFEVVKDVPYFRENLRDEIITRTGLGCAKKLYKLLSKYQCTSIEEYYLKN